MPMTVHSHAGVGSGVIPNGALQHIGQPPRPIGLAPRAGFLLVWNPVLLEDVVLAHRGLLGLEAILLILEAGLNQGESHRLEEPV